MRQVRLTFIRTGNTKRRFKKRDTRPTVKPVVFERTEVEVHDKMAREDKLDAELVPLEPPRKAPWWRRFMEGLTNATHR